MLYGAPSREAAIQQLQSNWDLIVIGGGITGAGIMREACRSGLNVLLLEQNDFASGTSSRSSKLVHGGLRYLNNFQLHLTYQSVVEREKLLQEGTGLVEKLPFVYPIFKSEKLPPWMIDFGLTLYDLMGKHGLTHRRLSPAQVSAANPFLDQTFVKAAFHFYDAQTDDARLVLRVIKEAVTPLTGDHNCGRSIALNYVRVVDLLRNDDGRVIGVELLDTETNAHYQVFAHAIINATGAWADKLRVKMGAQSMIRPLRGSHLVFSQDRFPLKQAISFTHPEDRRPVFAFPWEGITLLGTTDLDHKGDLDEEPAITDAEIRYLLKAVQNNFPSLALSEEDVIATFAGIRPVISQSHDTDPSKESREHALCNEDGLITVTGGKLTTFRQIAIDALELICQEMPDLKLDRRLSALDPLPTPAKDIVDGVTGAELRRLLGRYGCEILPFIKNSSEDERVRIPHTLTHLLELRWAARHEAVRHLDDLMLRRTRLGLVLADGGEEHLARIRLCVQEELGWDDARWQEEKDGYLSLWRRCYGTPQMIRQAVPNN